MSRGLNKVMIIGFVERDQEMRYTADGQPVTSFTVSTNRRWTTDAGKTRESTEWFTVVAWGSLALSAHQRIQKNQRIYAEGYLQTRKWKDADGESHYRTEVVANKFIPMDVRDALPQANLEANDEETPLCLNRAMVIGNLGRDPEMRYTPDGQ
ncbi:MAG: single-stranded DNA-binding protein, partial [Anaerolineae bacterium]